LALSVIFNSPLLVLADAPHVYRQSRAADFYKNLVTTWDKTVVLDSRFNQYLIKARKNGDTWYLGGITNWHERQLTFDLDFLGDSKQYQLVLYKDAPNAAENPKNIKVVTQTANKSTELTVEMASGGGFAGYLKPVK
jgi:alpha-glucosidase